MDNFILFFEIIGTVAFAFSGAMTAIKKEMDIFGVLILGVTTAVGGGIISVFVLRCLAIHFRWNLPQIHIRED